MPDVDLTTEESAQKSADIIFVSLCDFLINRINKNDLFSKSLGRR